MRRKIALLVTGACWHRACPPFSVIDFERLSALELNNRRHALYRKPTQPLTKLASAFPVMLQSLKVIVKHSGMADQTHLLWCFDVARSNDGATPRADNIKCRLEVFEFVGLRTYVSTHTLRINKSRSSFLIVSRLK